MPRVRVSAAPIELSFLGTGASGGTPGRGRSRRRESSLLVRGGGATFLFDVTRDFPVQATALRHVDLVLVTHAHRDASGGLPALDRFAAQGAAAIPVLASPSAIALFQRRRRPPARLRFVAVAPGEVHRFGRWRIRAQTVPHATDPRFVTYAWKLSSGGFTLVYASDVARLEAALERFCRGAELLVLDGAMWSSAMPWHLTIDRELPRLCRWRVERILLTQIGRTAPPHAELTKKVARLCPRARPAWDGMRLRLAPTRAPG